MGKIGLTNKVRSCERSHDLNRISESFIGQAWQVGLNEMSPTSQGEELMRHRRGNERTTDFFFFTVALPFTQAIIALTASKTNKIYH